MSDDDSSELSSAPSDIEDLQLEKKDGILKFFSKVSKKPAAPKTPASPPPPPRAPSPPHEYVLADNPDIAFAVMFRSRFSEAFPKSLPNFGPQELERGIVSNQPGELVEQFLCALLGLLLNRKQDVKAGHYNRALEEAIQTHKSQWAKDWQAKNPLSGEASFGSMTPTERLTLIRTLILWTMSSSQVVKDVVNASYKQNRHEDDLNQPLSVQPWGQDSYRKKYYLIEGLDDTNFRIYKEGGGIKERTWWSVAGTIEELNTLADKLSTDDGGQKARVLALKMRNAVPRFEATEEKRKRREYRQMRKEAFKRPEPGFSMYEGRTRGKRMKYTYSDDEDDIYSDDTSGARRSTRNTGTTTPAENGPTITASGRQVRSRVGGVYGESMLSGAFGLDGTAEGVASVDGASADDSEDVGRRPRRAAAVGNGAPQSRGLRKDYNSIDEMDDDSNGSEQDYGDDEEDGDHVAAETDEDDLDEPSDVEEDVMDLGGEDKQSLVIKLPIKTPTPERKSTVKLNLSPKMDASQQDSRDISKAIDETYSAGTNGHMEPGGSNVEMTSTEVFKAEASKPVDQAIPDTISLPAVIPETQPMQQSKPMDIPQSHRDVPASPSLVFRGSPTKSPGFPRTINVGQGSS